MCKIIIHAGMPKAGSSSIQSWLVDEALGLADNGVQVLVAPMQEASVEVRAYKHGDPINSGKLYGRYARHPEEREKLVKDFISSLEAVAEHHDTVVLSSEAFAQPFWKSDELFLSAFNQLSTRHQVVVAYYVRPQHTSLEAAWRQWGYRSVHDPEAYLLERAQQLHYLKTLRDTNRLAPRVDFRVRPFRNDLLHANDVVADFALHFLKMDDLELVPKNIHANLGLPLQVVNILRDLPEGLIWKSMHDNQRLNKLKDILRASNFENSDEICRSRQLICGFAHKIFEADNLELASKLDWQMTEFVPPAEDWNGDGLIGLNDLWTPTGSTAELHLLSCLINHIFKP